MGKTDFKKYWQDDLLAAISVALIALPISLVLAKASGYNPFAGIVTTIVGGVVMFFFGGSNVTITGPGYGLVIVLLNSLLTLGVASTLSASIIAGGFIFILGVLKLGKLSDFFPSAAIQGLLAAIGLTLIAKQLPFMLGVTPSGDIHQTYLEKLIHIPAYIFEFLGALDGAWTGGIGLISFLILISFSRLKKGYIKLIPAPMWVVLLSVGFYYYFVWFDSIDNFPIKDEDLMFIDMSNVANVSMPNFELIGKMDYWTVVLSIILVSLIESLLSIKAIDKLDPLKRRSNFNKDLRALGLATVISSFLGGLPVVTVISRSSVNVNQGGKTRLAGLFMAIILFLMIAFCVPILNKVPLSVLAAILVYTGYKLSAPKVWKKVLMVGKEQFVLFLITLLLTLNYGLVNGFLLGVFATFLLQVIMIKEKRDFIKYIFQPNVLSYVDNTNKYIVGVKGISNFLNFLRLKKSLDQIPRNNHVIVDFSLTDFVDHSVMEHVHYYEDEFKSKGGEFEVVGLDVHHSNTSHPLASRRMLKITRIVHKTTNLTKRQNDLKAYAKEIHWKFAPKSVFELPELSKFEFFKTKVLDHAYNVIRGFDGENRFEQFDIEYSEGELFAQERHRSSMLLIKLKEEIPSFILDKESIRNKVIKLTGKDDINFTEHATFSNKFHLEGNDELSIREFFSDDLIEFFELNPGYHVESTKDLILIIKKERLCSLTEVKEMLKYGRNLAAIIQDKFE